MISVRHLALLAALAALAGTGCATHLATLQTARPVQRGKVQVTGGTGAYLNVGPWVKVISEASAEAEKVHKAIAAGEGYTLEPESQKRLLLAGIALAALAPGVSSELQVRTGVLPETLDVGVRVTGNSVRGDGRYRLFHAGEDGEGWLARQSLDVSLGLGVTRHFFSNPLFTALKNISVDGFSRWDVDVPLSISAEYGRVFKVYGTARYLYSHTWMDPTVVEVGRQVAELTGTPGGVPAEVPMHYAGLTGGAAVGYGPLHLFFELTAGYTTCTPEIFGARQELGGLTFFPAVGLTFRTP